jgi:hypothetical protein
VVFSIERVGDEVQAVDDELSVWASARGNAFFLKPDAAVFPALATVSTWASGQRYEPAAVSTFLQVADYYLVAQAHAGSHTVVTHEVPSSTRKIKIPDLHRARHQVHDTLRDAAAGAGAVRAGTKRNLVCRMIRVRPHES